MYFDFNHLIVKFIQSLTEKNILVKTRFVFQLADEFNSRTFHNLRISRWQLLNFLFIFYDIFLKLNIVNFSCVCLKKKRVTN